MGDLIVDFGRAPASTYAEWGRQAGCRVKNQPLRFCRGAGRSVSGEGHLTFAGNGETGRSGMGSHWWDVTSVFLQQDLLSLLLLARLSKEFGSGNEIYWTRPGPLANALQQYTAASLHNLETGWSSVSRRLRHYPKAFSNPDPAQVGQVVQDKFDPEHSIRRRLRPRTAAHHGPVTLLPSGYVNVSRTAAAYAAVLPEEKFLLVCGRDAGKLKALPANVEQVSLDPYFGPNDSGEVASLLEQWRTLKSELTASSREFKIAESIGALSRIPELIRSGVATRNAWQRLFEMNQVKACLCADDSSPYSRIPLIIAKSRKLPALACHHGALDSGMAVKTQYANFYLAKGEMEYDYLGRVCKAPMEKVVMGGPPQPSSASISPPARQTKNLVFFTEPYEAYGWRRDEVYRDLLPELVALAKVCGLRLILKLHPFESREEHCACHS